MRFLFGLVFARLTTDVIQDPVLDDRYCCSLAGHGFGLACLYPKNCYMIRFFRTKKEKEKKERQTYRSLFSDIDFGYFLVLDIFLYRTYSSDCVFLSICCE